MHVLCNAYYVTVQQQQQHSKLFVMKLGIRDEFVGELCMN